MLAHPGPVPLTEQRGTHVRTTDEDDDGLRAVKSLSPPEPATDVEVTQLESRSLLSTTSPISLTETISPQMITSSNGRPVSVQVSGTVTDSDTAATLNKSLAYTVFDTQTNHQVRSGTATIDGSDSYTFNVNLHGRGFGRHHSKVSQFTISVMASDSDANSGTDSAVVIVTQQQRNGREGMSGGDQGSGSGSFCAGSEREPAAGVRATSISEARGRGSRTPSPSQAAIIRSRRTSRTTSRTHTTLPTIPPTRRLSPPTPRPSHRPIIRSRRRLRPVHIILPVHLPLPARTTWAIKGRDRTITTTMGRTVDPATPTAAPAPALASPISRAIRPLPPPGLTPAGRRLAALPGRRESDQVATHSACAGQQGHWRCARSRTGGAWSGAARHGDCGSTMTTPVRHWRARCSVAASRTAAPSARSRSSR